LFTGCDFWDADRSALIWRRFSAAGHSRLRNRRSCRHLSLSGEAAISAKIGQGLERITLELKTAMSAAMESLCIIVCLTALRGIRLEGLSHLATPGLGSE
jgi:hypothetical protein